MPAPGKQTTWDGNPNNAIPTTAPYRPGSADFNGLGLVNDAVNPPNAATMPTADLLNAWSAFCITFGRLVPNLTMSVKYVTGTPTLDSLTAAPTAVNSQTTALTIARTGGGAANGDISVTWPAGTFPASVTQPKASLNGTSAGMIAISQITNGVRIVTLNSVGAATDLPFTFDLL